MSLDQDNFMADDYLLLPDGKQFSDEPQQSEFNQPTFQKLSKEQFSMFPGAPHKFLLPEKQSMNPSFEMSSANKISPQPIEQTRTLTNTDMPTFNTLSMSYPQFPPLRSAMTDGITPPQLEMARMMRQLSGVGILPGLPISTRPEIPLRLGLPPFIPINRFMGMQRPIGPQPMVGIAPRFAFQPWASKNPMSNYGLQQQNIMPLMNMQRSIASQANGLQPMGFAPQTSVFPQMGTMSQVGMPSPFGALRPPMNPLALALNMAQFSSNTNNLLSLDFNRRLMQKNNDLDNDGVINAGHGPVRMYNVKLSLFT